MKTLNLTYNFKVMNVYATTIIFLHKQINLLFIVSLNKLFRVITDNKITPIILNIGYHIKHRVTPSY
jgi:hypothetical protein